MDARIEAPGRWYDVVVTAVHHQVAAKASHDLMAAALEVPILVLSTPQPHGVGWDDVPERIRRGRVDAAEQLADVQRRWPAGSDGPGVYTVAPEVCEDLRLTGVVRE